MRINHLMTIVLLAGAVTNARAQTLSTGANTAAGERTVFVPPNSVVRIRDLSVFVKGSEKTLTINVISPTTTYDTTRLNAEANAVRKAEAWFVKQQHITRVDIVFQHPGRTVAVIGLSAPDVSVFPFALGADGKWGAVRRPPLDLKLNVAGKP